MTPNTSATGGYLRPIGEQPIEDQALDRFLQQLVVGVTGLDGKLVRPRWQPEPGNLPGAETNWAAIGVNTVNPDDYAVELHNPEDDGNTQLQRHEILNVLCSFYGPDANAYASMFRDGLQVEQNRFAITAAGMGLVETGDPIAVPSLIKDALWQKRVDVPLLIKRAAFRTYGVLNLDSAEGTIDAEQVQVEFEVEP